MLTIYTTTLTSEDKRGRTIGPIIFIHPKYQRDAGLMAHQKVHQRQWLRTLGLHSILYLIIPPYRLSCEVEAYRAQLRYYGGDKADQFAEFIATKYNLKISKDEAKRLLTK